MDIELIKDERKKWFEWKNTKPLKELCDNLPQIDDVSVSLDDTIKVSANITDEQKEQVLKTAHALKPWRKGPFDIFGIHIDSEWLSNIKYNTLKPHFDLKGKVVADVGCNNGYYMLRMLNDKPRKIIGFDPSPLMKLQFDFVNHFVKSDILFELLGIEHIEHYKTKFDTIFCLGVLYHRGDPIASLKSLQRGLKPNGELFLDTFIIDGDDDVALTPKSTYAKMPNVYFVPTIPALSNWLIRAGFDNIQVIDIALADNNEQRRTIWINGESLEDFCDLQNNTTAEGYPLPKRVYIKANKKSKE